jgi:hypothetical protein
MNHFTSLLQRAAFATSAADPCRDWEVGGDTDLVADTAWEADEATREALDAVAGIAPPSHSIPIRRPVSAAS